MELVNYMSDQIYFVYIHGIASQQISYPDIFHQNLINALKKNKSQYKVNNHSKISICWYNEIECILKGYQKTEGRTIKILIKRLIRRIILAILIFATYLFILDYFSITNPGILVNSLLIILFIFSALTRPIMAFLLINGVDPLAIEVFWYTRGKQACKNGEPSIVEDRIIDHIKELIDSKLSELPEKAKVVFIGHSLGSVIAFDYLFKSGYIFEANRKQESLQTKFILKGLVTMGSPIPLFISALGYITSNVVLGSEPFIQSNDVVWYNLHDLDDPIARKCEPLFPNLINKSKQKQLQDIEVNTGIFLLSHLNYWKRPLFRKLLQRLPIISGDKKDPASLIAKMLSS
jgi:hypothetical protein